MNISGRILLADSDEKILFTTANLLQREGYQCTPARDGFEAFRALEANEYDLLITEIMMPGNEDLELVWCADRCAPEMPIIICTGHASLRSAITSIQLSVAAYLIKPVPSDVLLHHVKASIASDRGINRITASSEGLHDCRDELAQIDLLSSAIKETIEVLQSTRGAFKSQQLAALRVKLQQLLASGQSK